MIRELTLTYRADGVLAYQHLMDFFGALSLHLLDKGIPATLRGFRAGEGVKGTPYWVVLIDLPRGNHIPHLDKAGLWPHGMTSVANLRGQVAVDSAGWFAGLYARWSICATPDFLTHSRNSAPDTFSGVSQ
ncbi:MAG: rolling circle replication-associated protein [Stenotrophomonas rhizophila]|uniref:rolling circle replication-associated protein n=1 Tax=Stenotrophomonas rhizophila TaxID=216778 RepID=UPI003D13BD39